MGKIITDEKGEYSFLSDSGVEYSLYEGESIGGNTTSDIVFVMNDKCIGINTELVGWIYGAFLIIGSEEVREDIQNNIDRMVQNYENNNPDLVAIWLKNENKDIQWHNNGKIIYGTVEKCVNEVFRRIKFNGTPFPDFSWAVCVDEEVTDACDAYESASGWFGCRDVGGPLDAPFSIIFNHYGGGGMECIELSEDYLETAKPLFTNKMLDSCDECGYTLRKDDRIVIEFDKEMN